MVTFKNVKKVKSFVQKPEKVKNQNNKIPEFEKSTIFRRSSRSSGFSSSSSATSAGLSLPSEFLFRENEQGWRVSPGYEFVKQTTSRRNSSNNSTKSLDVFAKQGTMEILDSYKSMQNSFRSLPLMYPKEK